MHSMSHNKALTLVASDTQNPLSPSIEILLPRNYIFCWGNSSFSQLFQAWKLLNECCSRFFLLSSLDSLTLVT